MGTLAEAGLEERAIAQAVRRIGEGEYGEVHSLLIVKDDRLVLDEYLPGHVWEYDSEHFHGPEEAFDPYTPHTIMSITKAAPRPQQVLPLRKAPLAASRIRYLITFRPTSSCARRKKKR